MTHDAISNEDEPSMIDRSRYDDSDSLLDGYMGHDQSNRNFVIRKRSK